VAICVNLVYNNVESYGGDLVSTRIAKPKVHVEGESSLVKLNFQTIVTGTLTAANDENFAVAKAAA